MVKYRMLLVSLLSVSSIFYGCKDLEDPPTGAAPVYDNTPYALSYGELPAPTIAADNPLTEQGVQLGRMLFYEKQLSRTGTMACASCHLQTHAFSDPRTLSLGVDNLPGKRQAMSVFNLAWHNTGFFWDGRANLLRDQSLMPIQDHLEMDESLDRAVAKLKQMPIYRNQFIRAFGNQEISALKVSLALEQFMNSIVSSESKYDQFLRGDLQLDASEERGRVLFFAEYNPFFPEVSGADCQHCHSGRNFDNVEFRNNGLDAAIDMKDFGYETVTGNVNDRAKFKIPSLRNIALTAPYMHDGRFNTLEEVVDHYDTGIHESPTLDVTLRNTLPNGLLLTQQDKEDLIAFLHTLTDLNMPTNPAYASPF